MGWLWDIFGNDDDREPVEEYKPNLPQWLRKFMWYMRNPCHNLTWYKWGIVAYVRAGNASLFERIDKEWFEVFAENREYPWSSTWAKFGGWKKTKWVIKSTGKKYKYKSYTWRNLEKRRDYFHFYWGIRPTSGAWGAKCQPYFIRFWKPYETMKIWE
jgi:hypothetical protein